MNRQALKSLLLVEQLCCSLSHWAALDRRCADSLADALVKAYQTSPLLDSNRAALRGVDETVPQARAGRRPQVDASASLTSQTTAEAIEDQLNQHAGGAECLAADLRQRRDQGGDRVGAQPDRRRPGRPEGRRAAGALQRGAGLCRRAPRPGVRPARQQRRRPADRDAGRDAEPLRRRRGHPHRRQPEPVAAGRLALDPGGGPGAARGLARRPTGGGRRAAGQPRAAAAAAAAAEVARTRRPRSGCSATRGSSRRSSPSGSPSTTSTGRSRPRGRRSVSAPRPASSAATPSSTAGTATPSARSASRARCRSTPAAGTTA